MDQRKRLHKKGLRNAALHPLPMVVLGTGVTTAILTGQWWLIPIGVLVYGIVTLSNLKNAFEELQAEAQKAQEESLNSLEERLQSDEDPRTERLLRELRFLNNTFKEGITWPNNLTSDLLLEISTKVRELFRECVAHIERTLELWHIAEGLDSKRGREMILNQRETIIQEVESSVEQLGNILARVLDLGIEERGDTELARIRRELDQILEVARQVEQELRGLRALDIGDEGARE